MNEAVEIMLWSKSQKHFGSPLSGEGALCMGSWQGLLTVSGAVPSAL